MVRFCGSANAVVADVEPTAPSVCRTVIELVPREEMAFCTD